MAEREGAGFVSRINAEHWLAGPIWLLKLRWKLWGVANLRYSGKFEYLIVRYTPDQQRPIIDCFRQVMRVQTTTPMLPRELRAGYFFIKPR